MSYSVSGTVRWIVIPPFLNDAGYRAAVAAATEKAGLRLHDIDLDPTPPEIDGSDTVFLTADAHKALAAGVAAEALACIISDQGMRLLGDEDQDALPPHIAIFTDLMGRTGLLPQDRLFRDTDFVSGPIEILPGIRVERPAPGSTALSPRLQAVTRAVALLDPSSPTAFWAPELFNYDSRRIPGGKPGELDLTGRPRFMITGPYITLPAGRWRATYRLTFDAKGSRVRFRTDWGGQTDFISEEFTPGRPGVFEIVQEYEWKEPAPCELRVVVLEGVFDGRMTFSGAEISLIS